MHRLATLLLGCALSASGGTIAAHAAAAIGSVFRDCADCPQMVVVPAGEFTEAPPAAGTPPHRVRIGSRFAVGRYEITRGEYAQFVAAAGHAGGDKCFVFQRMGADGVGVFGWVAGAGWRNPGYFQTDRDPVVCVSWNDAHAYIDWLNARTHRDYRLLSESEWAYVASEGKGRLPWWSNEADACLYANSADRSFQQGFPALRDIAPCNDGHAFTAPVGSYRPNAFGLYDLLGNAWEWTEDCGAGTFERAPADGSPDLSGDCRNRVRRGGSWYRTADNNRSALPAADWHGNGGFRVASSLP